MRDMHSTPIQYDASMKIKATDVEVIINNRGDNPYYEIKYRTEPNGEYHIGYGSYDFKNITHWLNECFEIEGDNDDNRG